MHSDKKMYVSEQLITTVHLSNEVIVIVNFNDVKFSTFLQKHGLRYVTI